MSSPSSLPCCFIQQKYLTYKPIYAIYVQITNSSLKTKAMGFFDGFSKDNREKKGKFNKGRTAYYHDPEVGAKQMADNARTKGDFKKAAAKRWQIVYDKSGSQKAFADPTYKELMVKAENA